MILKKVVRIFFASLSFTLSLLLFTQYALAATLTTIFDQLDRAKQAQTQGVGQIIVFTPTTTVTGGTDSVLRLQFPLLQNGQWCRTIGALTATASTYQSATGLPGTTLSATCSQGNGTTTYDTIDICAVTSNTWTAGVTYGVRVVDSTGKLGTATTAANDNKVIVTTGYAATCVDPTTIMDTGLYALSVLANDQVAVTATVDPLFSFSITNLTIGFGEFPSTTKRWATTNALGATAEPVAQNPSYFTITTNAPNGAMVAAASTGSGAAAGLYKSIAPAKLIAATYANNVTTGAEGYALYVKNIGTSLAAVSGWSGSTATNTISTTLQSIVTASGPVSSNNSADIALVAAIATSTPAGAYSDAITLVGTGKF
jgi:hypothetical protein